MNRRTAAHLLNRRGWLASTPAEFRAAVLASSHLATFDTGAFIFHAGDLPGGIYGVADGGVGAYLVAENDSLRLATILRSGVWFGQGPLFHGGQRTMTFRATEPTTAFQVPLAALKAIGGHSVEWAKALGAINEQAMSVAVRVIIDLSLPKSASRIAATLLRCADLGDEPPADVRRLRLTQDQLAEMSNTSRQTASRHLVTFEARGWIALRYGEIVLHDLPALARQVNLKG